MNVLGPKLVAVSARPWQAVRRELRHQHGRPSSIATQYLRIALRQASPIRAAICFQPTRRGRLEAVLFLDREPFTLRRMAQLANLTDAPEARTLLSSLREDFDCRGCAFHV